MEEPLEACSRCGYPGRMFCVQMGCYMRLCGHCWFSLRGVLLTDVDCSDIHTTTCELCTVQICGHCNRPMGEPRYMCPDGCGQLCRGCVVLCSIEGCRSVLPHVCNRICAQHNDMLWIVLCAAARAVGPLPTELWLHIADQMYVGITHTWRLPSRTG